MRLTLIGILLGGMSATVEAQTEVWLTQLGNDTLAFERFTRSADKLEGEYLVDEDVVHGFAASRCIGV